MCLHESRISVVWLFVILFVLNSAQSTGKKNNWKFDYFLLVKNYSKESLLSMFCFIIKGKGSSEKGLILNSGGKFILLRIVNFDTDWVSCFHARNEIGRVFFALIANMLFQFK